MQISNNKGIAFKELIFIILLAGGLLIPAAVVKQWWLFGVFAVFFVCFGLVEWLAVAKTNKTVSQHFWEYSKTHKTGAWVVLGFMVIAWFALLWHLAAKLL